MNKSGHRREFPTGAIRHYLKYLDGQENENHFIAFVWNIICAIWTNNNLPEMRDLPYEQENI
jgi:hypothetical protein